MASFVEPVNPQWIAVRKLAPTDAVDATTEDSPDNKTGKDLVERTSYLKAGLDAIDLAFQQGNDTFNGVAGRVVVHNLNNASYVPYVAPTANPGGDLGEVWFAVGANSFTVYNSGTWGGAFRWALLKA